MRRKLSEIQPVPTSHGVGSKRVLLSSNESDCSLTQIAVTELKAGDVAVAHVHADMQEGFYVLQGELDVVLDGKVEHCSAEDFVYVNCCTSHELRATTDCRIMTIGCVIEASRNKLYPMLFKPNRKTLVWGTEDWTVSTVPGSVCEVENGTWARYMLDDVIAKMPEAILGKATVKLYRQRGENVISRLPLLTKVIQAHQDLSIQVHPDDEMARREHGKLGKSEMWYVIDAEPGAFLYAGFRCDVTPDDIRRFTQAKGEDGLPETTDGEPRKTLTDVLARHEVHPGDVFYLPAGRVHAICGGITLAEVQQASDVTYRIYDYNRPGLDGLPRELHTDLAVKALDYTVYPEYRTQHREETGSIDRVLDTPHFSVSILDTHEPFHRNLVKYDSFIIVMCLKNDCCIRIRTTKDQVELREGQSCLIPAAIADYDVVPLFKETGVKILETYINHRRTFKNFITNFWHSTR